VVQIRRLRPGDRVGVGRSVLLFGSEQEINARANATLTANTPPGGHPVPNPMPATLHAQTLAGHFQDEADFELNVHDKITEGQGTLFLGPRALPPLPQKLTPSQAARLAELLEFLHRHLTAPTENAAVSEEGGQVTLGYADWQRILAVQMVLARYARAVAEPDALDE
jgi:hypothetical protein